MYGINSYYGRRSARDLSRYFACYINRLLIDWSITPNTNVEVLKKRSQSYFTMLTYAVSLEENISRNFSKLLDVNNRIGFQRQQFAISKRLIKYDMLMCESKIWRAILGSVKQYPTDIVSILKGVACFQSTCMHFREQTATGKKQPIQTTIQC